MSLYKHSWAEGKFSFQVGGPSLRPVLGAGCPCLASGSRAELGREPWRQPRTCRATLVRGTDCIQLRGSPTGTSREGVRPWKPRLLPVPALSRCKPRPGKAGLLGRVCGAVEARLRPPKAPSHLQLQVEGSGLSLQSGDGCKWRTGVCVRVSGRGCAIHAQVEPRS